MLPPALKTIPIHQVVSYLVAMEGHLHGLAMAEFKRSGAPSMNSFVMAPTPRMLGIRNEMEAFIKAGNLLNWILDNKDLIANCLTGGPAGAFSQGRFLANRCSAYGAEFIHSR